ncbi:MAG TPA: regulatory protein RecX [Candidatus Limnocylindrales bacterium]|nr:regulatory protein RecX [Candidatus Limnocylindrales bacterium]
MADRRATAAARRERRAQVDDPGVVMEAAAAFLAVRSRSVAETRRRLRHLGYRQALVEQVLERLVEMAYLDDEAFARAWVESRDRARPRGASALRRELALKGVPRETVEAILGERDEWAGRAALVTGAGDRAGGVSADEAAAGRLLERRGAALLRETDARRRRQRAYALLARSGFDPEVCRTAAAAWLAAAGDVTGGQGEEG